MQNESPNSKNNKIKKVVDINVKNHSHNDGLKQIVITNYLKKILEYIKKDKDENNKWDADIESRLAFVLSVVALHMWENGGIEKLARIMMPYAAQVMIDDDERKNIKNEKLDKLQEELREEILRICNNNALSNQQKEDLIAKFIHAKNAEYNVEIQIPFIQHENAPIAHDLGDEKFDFLLLNIGMEASLSKNMNDKFTADILSRLLLVRKFGIAGAMMQQLNKHRMFYDSLVEHLNNPQDSLKKKKEAEVLNDKKTNENVQKLLEEALNNNKKQKENGSDNSNTKE
jgi:hypothetical protein